MDALTIEIECLMDKNYLQTWPEPRFGICNFFCGNNLWRDHVE